MVPGRFCLAEVTGLRADASYVFIPLLKQDLNYMASLSHANTEVRIMKGAASAVGLTVFLIEKCYCVTQVVSPQFLKAMNKFEVQRKSLLQVIQQIFLEYSTWRICFMKNVQGTVLC